MRRLLKRKHGTRPARVALPFPRGAVLPRRRSADAVVGGDGRALLDDLALIHRTATA